MTNEQKINLIGQKILLLSNQVDQHRRELDALKDELERLKHQQAYEAGISKPKTPQNPVDTVTPVTPVETVMPVQEVKTPVMTTEQDTVLNIAQEQRTVVQPVQPAAKAGENINLEERIGSKIFSIIGIIALVLGVSIGVKYAIDKDLINETGRLVLGYAAGIVLLTLAFVYKKKYEVFSAVLLSGAMAIMYFTTFLGYSYYHKYPASVAFVVMALFTGFTVFAAHVYNYEVIALIGLVGGYALPPLLSTGGGEIQYMFGFMLLLNLGVLALSFLKYWKFVNHVAYGLTWLIFASWMVASYDPEQYFGRTMFFATAFYLIFYLSFISYKLFRNKPFSAWDIVLVLSNSLIYFGVGYNALNMGVTTNYERYEGLFCIFNALVHLGFALLCRKKELADKTIFHFIIAMVISFLTIAVPIQLNGHSVTLVWLTEMLVLLWMWRQFRSKEYIVLASALSVLSFFSLLNDWTIYYNGYRNIELMLPVATNRYFITGLCGIAAYWGARQLLKSREEGEEQPALKEFAGVLRIIITVVAVLVTYFTFANEIGLYFNKQYTLSETRINGSYGYSYTEFDESWGHYKFLWILNYTALFVALAGIINMRLKQKLGLYISWGFAIVTLFVVLTAGLVSLEGLRPENRMAQIAHFPLTAWDYNFRYLCLLFAALLLWMIYLYRNNGLLKPLKAANTWLFHIGLLVLLSSELTDVMVRLHPESTGHYRQVSYRMGYTVLWGLYSMLLIVYGIVRQKKLLRIIAISLFGATILKLAIDALSMTRGYQLIVFITIGVILLIVSFMYQKFKPLLFGNDAQKQTDEQDAA